MGSLKRFTIGFAVGIGLMYWYLHYSEATRLSTISWFSHAASNYRGDPTHKAAKEEFGER